MKRLFIFALVATLFAACSTDTTQDLAPEIPVAPDELYVSFDEEDTRVQLGENGAPVWNDGDLVSVFYRSNSNDKYRFQGETGDTSGSLKLISSGTPTVGLDNVVAVYPYSDNYLVSLFSGNIRAMLPNSQTYLKDSFGIGSSIMVSSSRTGSIYLKNVCGWLKLQFAGSGVIRRIVLRGNDGEQVAGNIYINAEDASCELAAHLDSAGGSGSGDLEGSVVVGDTVFNDIQLLCGTGVPIDSQQPTAFYIALPPQTFKKGVTITLYGTQGYAEEISTSKSITIQRNHITPMKTTYVDIPIPNNEIWYTSSDGNIVKPNKTDIFGANIVSNTYENGQGIISFDGEVTKIGKEAFRGYVDEAETICYNLTNIILPNCITEISECAFERCAKIKYITIPDCVTTIGDHAFRECFSLTDITIPNSVTSIGDMAFAYSRSLKVIKFPDDDYSIGYGPTYGCSALEQMTGKYTTADKLSLIKDGKLISIATGNITTYNVPDEVVTIEKGLYRGRNSKNTEGWLSSFTGKFATPDGRCLVEDNVLKAVAGKNIGDFTIPDGVVSTTFGVLYGCKDLTSVTIPESVTSIAQFAFLDCTNLRTVYCESATPPSLGGKVFDNNASDRKIYTYAECVDVYKAASGWKNYADSIYADGNYPADGVTTSIYYTTSDEQIVSPSGLSIKSNTYNNGVGELVVCGVLKNIPAEAFCMCSSLTSVTIPDSVTEIGKDAFKDCNALTGVYITDLEAWCKISFVGNAGGNPLKYAHNLYLNGELVEDLVIPSGITTLNFAAFYGATCLKSVIIPTSVIDIKKSVFSRCSSLTSVTIGNSVTTIGEYAFGFCDSLTSVTIPDSVTEMGDKAFYHCDSLTSVTIPDSVTTIGNYAFSSCSSLTSVTIPDSVTTIGERAFGFCYSLTSVTIGNSVTTIGEGAFWSCGSLTSVTIGNSVTTIGDYAFFSCSSLTSVTIPDSVTTIGNGAFSDCSSLTSVTIPDSVTTIGNGAFEYCSSLKEVYCKPTTPPSLDSSSVFYYNASGRRIYVPTASVDAYKAATYWDWYADAIEPYEF